ncbi:MAG TPA: glycosyltransferase [Chitinophagaceae bacterium]|nr:glycosyltransferase [Chitinophagaceae bacterium]
MLILFYVCFALLFVYLFIISYYEAGWKKLPEVPRELVDEYEPRTAITVIIPARNEEKNILNCLDSLTNQTYPAELLQIIVVNDHSTDNTEAVVKNFPCRNVLLINLADHITDPINSYKKKAIEIAVEHASGELIVTTDADCTAPPRWLYSIAAVYNGCNAAFIGAPVKLAGTSGKQERSLLFVFQALDFMTLQGITASSVAGNVHSMCNGANMAYPRRAFYEVNGYEGIDQIASGDDMLLMHKIAKRYPGRLAYIKSQDTIVSTVAASSWKAFLNQRIRWASKANKYDDRRIIIALTIVYAQNVSLFLLMTGCFFYPEWLYKTIMVLLAKTVGEYFFVSSVAGFFNRRKLMIWFPLLQPLHITYTVVAGFFGQIGKYSWKDRKVV